MELWFWSTWWIIFNIRFSILFWVYFKKTKQNIDNPSIRIYKNKIEIRMRFKNKIVYYLDLLIPESMKSLWSTETKTENHEIVPHSEITAVVLLYCNIVNNDYYQDSRVLYLFVSNKLFASLYLFIKSHIFLKAFKSEFQEIEVWFTDQNSHPLEKKII